MNLSKKKKRKKLITSSKLSVFREPLNPSTATAFYFVLDIPRGEKNKKQITNQTHKTKKQTKNQTK